MPSDIKPEIQVAVDRYLDLYQKSKQLTEQMMTLREIIEPYMKDNNLSSITGSDGQARVELIQQARPPMTARYTTYDVEQIAKLLPPNVRKKCVVEVVDRDKLEALCKLGEIPGDIVNHKVTTQTFSLTVRMAK